MLAFKFETKNRCIQVNGNIDSNVVANKFANHFHKTYSCNTASRAAELHSQNLYRRHEYQGLPLTENIDVNLLAV